MSPPYKPWFVFERQEPSSDKIIFGHWAALQGKDCGKNLYALDTGCIWGGPLRAMKLENQQYFHYYP
jgi:bis(5'-nucleosyl)-tetraphosphatase (symmetrical)